MLKIRTFCKVNNAVIFHLITSMCINIVTSSSAESSKVKGLVMEKKVNRYE